MFTSFNTQKEKRRQFNVHIFDTLSLHIPIHMEQFPTFNSDFFSKLQFHDFKLNKKPKLLDLITLQMQDKLQTLKRLFIRSKNTGKLFHMRQIYKTIYEKPKRCVLYDEINRITKEIHFLLAVT